MNAPTPSAETRAVVDAGRAECLYEFCELLASYAVSAQEAAWRGDLRELGSYLDRARLVLIEARKLHAQLTADPRQGEAPLD